MTTQPQRKQEGGPESRRNNITGLNEEDFLAPPLDGRWGEGMPYVLVSFSFVLSFFCLAVCHHSALTKPSCPLAFA